MIKLDELKDFVIKMGIEIFPKEEDIDFWYENNIQILENILKDYIDRKREANDYINALNIWKELQTLYLGCVSFMNSKTRLLEIYSIYKRPLLYCIDNTEMIPDIRYIPKTKNAKNEILDKYYEMTNKVEFMPANKITKEKFIKTYENIFVKIESQNNQNVSQVLFNDNEVKVLSIIMGDTNSPLYRKVTAGYITNLLLLCSEVNRLRKSGDENIFGIKRSEILNSMFNRFK